MYCCRSTVSKDRLVVSSKTYRIDASARDELVDLQLHFVRQGRIETLFLAAHIERQLASRDSLRSELTDLKT